MEKAYFAGGCFWCIAPIFAEQNGVIKVISGYCGGNEINPSYEQVKRQETGHRETICIEYDENIISYDKLLEIFAYNVDPFDKDGQYIDKGFSYTLAIFYQNKKELIQAQKMVESVENYYNKKAYISIEKYKIFYKAEEYHQDYYKKHPKEFLEELKKSGRSAK